MNIFDNRDFQNNIVHLMLFDEIFLASRGHVVKPGYFRTAPHKALSTIAKSFYEKYGRMISDLELSVEIDRFAKSKAAEKLEVTAADVLALLNEIKAVPFPDRDWHTDQLIPFAKLKEATAFSKRMKASLDNDGEIDIGLFDVLMETYKGLETDATDAPVNFFKNLDILAQHSSREAIPLPWPTINRFAEGIGKGELWSFLGKTNIGKSNILAGCGISALMAGYNVFHLSLEDRERNIAMRYAAGISGVQRSGIGATVKEVIEMLKQKSKVCGTLVMKYYDSYSIKASDVKRIVREIEKREQVQIDLVIVDYAPLLKPESGDNPDWASLEMTMRVFRSGIISLEKRGLTAFQADKASEKCRTLTWSNLGKSYGMAQVVDGGLSINQTSEEMEEKKMRLYLLKLKDSAGVGNTVEIVQNHGTCRYTESCSYEGEFSPSSKEKVSEEILDEIEV